MWGTQGRLRTPNRRSNNPLLYLLSYPGLWPAAVWLLAWSGRQDSNLHDDRLPKPVAYPLAHVPQRPHRAGGAGTPGRCRPCYLFRVREALCR